MSELLRLDCVGLRYPGGTRALDGIELTLAAGETLALVGESGSGKSSLARLVLGLERPSSGRILVDGHDLAGPKGAGLDRVGRRWLASTVQLVFQEAQASLSPLLTVRALLAEPLRVQGMSPAEHWPRVEALLRRVGLPSDVLHRTPRQLSGGQARRVGLVRALVPRPRLLVADEPTAGLDLSVRGDTMALLAELQREHGLGLLLVTHDLPLARIAAARIAVLRAGRIVEQGETAALLDAPRHPYTRELVAAAKTLSGVTNAGNFSAKDS